MEVKNLMDNITHWLKKLISFNTTMDEGDTSECAIYIESVFNENNIACNVIKTGAGSMVEAIVPGTVSDSVLLHAHLDTAPYLRELNWRFPPDKPLEKKGLICGRGAVDCKGQAAVWMKLMCDAAKRQKLIKESDGFKENTDFISPNISDNLKASDELKAAKDNAKESTAIHSPKRLTLKLLFTCDEESGGKEGLGELLIKEPHIFDNVRLVIGEGGGFDFPFGDKICYTFQTGEREDSIDREVFFFFFEIERIVKLGITKGYYSEELLRYIKSEEKPKKQLDIKPLYVGMEEYFKNAPNTTVFSDYGALLESILKESIPNAKIVPVITPGYSDNRYFRKLGIPVIGFFPFYPGSHILMHGANEHISLSTLSLAYEVMGNFLKQLIRY